MAPTSSGRVANASHASLPWRIHEIVPDFTLEDVWVLPARGGAGDFDRLLALGTDLDPANADSRAARFLWRVRDRLGAWFDLGRISEPEGGNDRLPIPGTEETTLADRLPPDLRAAEWDRDFGSLPFRPLFRTDTEAAAEISNRTVHGVMHLGWAETGDGEYQGRMAVYVKPRGRLGHAYMAFIKPFRYAIVYPALLRQFERRWDAGQS